MLNAEVMAIAVEECFDDLDAPPERVTGAEVPMPYAQNLEAAALPQVRNLAMQWRCCTYMRAMLPPALLCPALPSSPHPHPHPYHTHAQVDHVVATVKRMMNK